MLFLKNILQTDSNMDINRNRVLVKITSSSNIIQEASFGYLYDAIHLVTKEMQKLTEGINSEIIICRQDKCPHQSQLQSHAFATDTNYDIDLIKQQILLFDNQNQILSFIETEKLLAENPINQLTQLTNCLFRIAKDLLSKPRPLIDFTAKDQNYTKQRLDKIEQECMNTLKRVKEQRRRIQNCCICLSEKSSFVVIPCMHMVVCGKCGVGLQKCPICSHAVNQIKEVYQ